MADAFHTEEKEFHGLSVRIEYLSYSDMAYPWVEYDGCGVIREVCSYYGRPDKKPGEVIIYSDGGNYFIYDFQATTKKAKSEGWGVSDLDTTGMSKKQITRESVLRNMEYCRKFLNGDLFYIGIKCTVLDYDGSETEHEDSCWGFEYGYWGEDSEYADKEAESMAENLAKRVKEERLNAWRKALHEAKERKYWASRDIETVGA